MELKGDIVKINEISQSEIEEMYILMTEFYNNVDKDVFLKDFKEKDYCIILKDNKNTIDLDLNGDGNIVSTNSLKTNEKINKNKVKEVKEYTSPEYMVRYEGRENTNFQIQVKITTKEINQQVKHFYIYYLNIAVKPISDFTKRTVNISTKVLDNGGI